MLDSLWQDTRYALRGLQRTPGFSIAALLTLAVAIAASTSVFSLVNGILLRPLSYPEPDRLVVIHEVLPRWTGQPAVPVNAMHFREWRARTRSFDAMALVSPIAFNLTGEAAPERLAGARVSPALFALLGVEPVLGRVFRDDEDQFGRDRVVVLGDALWRRRFAADPAILGRTIRLDDEPFEVVGILPATLRVPKLSSLFAVSAGTFEEPQLFKPFAARPGELTSAGAFNHIALARLSPGVSLETATADVATVQDSLTTEAGDGNVFQARLMSLQGQITIRSRTALLLVLGTVGLVLLIACVNIANLLLTRSLQRRRDMAIRRAAGASALRLASQLLIEGLMLAVSAGIVGMLAAQTIVRATLSYAPVDLPRVDEVTLDAAVLLFTLAVSVGAGLLIALLPAWLASRIEPAEALRGAARSLTASRSVQHLRTLLVGVEVAVSTVCLVASGLLLHSFVNLMNVERGFQEERILTATLTLPAARYPTPERRSAFIDRLLERARTIPGIAAAGVVDRLPVSGAVSNSGLAVEGTSLPQAERPNVRIHIADPGYFPTMAIPLRSGRLFAESDRPRRTAVISTRAAQVLWPDQDAVGKRFRFGPDDSPLIEVIGVVGNVQAVTLGDVPPLSVYLPPWQWPAPIRQISLAVRTASSTAGVASAVRDLIRQMDANLPVPPLRSMDDIVSTSVASRRFQMTLVLVLAVAALLLAGLGVYAVLAQSVAQRTNELGIRIALGAVASDVRAIVLRQALTPVMLGLTAGMTAAAGLGPLVRGLLFGISSSDAVTYLATAAFLLTTALIASYLPARRAMRIQPVVALRAE